MTPSAPTHTITQVSIMNALLVSKFDGLLPVKDLLEHGNHGIGTFNQMDGEMIVIDGVIYQGKADGKTYQPDPENLTPFGTVCNFVPDITWELTEPVDYPGLDESINEMAPNPNGLSPAFHHRRSHPRRPPVGVRDGSRVMRRQLLHQPRDDDAG